MFASPMTRTAEEDARRQQRLSNLQELEILKEQYAQAEMSLNSSIKEQGAMYETLVQYRENGDKLEEALQASVGSDDHMRILREMSQDYLASIQRWEERQKTTEREHKAMFEAEVRALQGALMQRRAQLDGLGPAAEETEELQRARRECQELEAESTRLADQLQQLAQVQPWVAQRQSQVENAQLRVLETWRGLQSKIDAEGAGAMAPSPPGAGCAASSEQWLPQLAPSSAVPQAMNWPPQSRPQATPQPMPPSPQGQRPAATLTRGPLPYHDSSPRAAPPPGAPGGHCGAPVPPGTVLRSFRR